MNLLQTVAVAFAMYSAIPMPRFDWNRSNMRYVMLAFPLVGTVTGLLLAAAQWACIMLRLPIPLFAAVSTVLPVLITGGIHLDGFADTSDALSSHRDREKMLSIMQDPHIGTFAVIKLGMVFVMTYALWSCASESVQLLSFGGKTGAWILLPACMTLSRILSGLSVCSFPAAKDSGLVHLFAEAADRRRVRRILIAADVFVSALLCFLGIQGIASVLAAHLVWLYSRQKTKRVFGGITGDTCGWFLVLAELAMLTVVILTLYCADPICKLLL